MGRGFSQRWKASALKSRSVVACWGTAVSSCEAPAEPSRPLAASPIPTNSGVRFNNKLATLKDTERSTSPG